MMSLRQPTSCCCSGSITTLINANHFFTSGSGSGEMLPSVSSLAKTARTLAASLPVAQLDSLEVSMEHCPSSTSAIEAYLDLGIVAPISVPRVVLANRPLEISLAHAGPSPGTHGSASIARCFSAHAHLSLCIRLSHGCVLSSELVPVTVRRSLGGWVARALVHPVAWVVAATVTVVSLSLWGRPLTYDCLPATL